MSEYDALLYFGLRSLAKEAARWAGHLQAHMRKTGLWDSDGLCAGPTGDCTVRLEEPAQVTALGSPPQVLCSRPGVESHCPSLPERVESRLNGHLLKAARIKQAAGRVW